MTDRYDFTFDVEAFLDEQDAQEASGQERLLTFPLHATSIGKPGIQRILCRRLNLMDRASISYLPSELQNTVWKQLRKASEELQRLQTQGATPKDINEAMANNDKMLAVADVMCEYGWVKPRVVRDRSREDRHAGVLWVGRFKGEDRIAYMIGCGDADSEQARHFRDAPARSDDDAPDRENREVLEYPTERAAGDASPGLFAHESVQSR